MRKFKELNVYAKTQRRKRQGLLRDGEGVIIESTDINNRQQLLDRMRKSNFGERQIQTC